MEAQDTGDTGMTATQILIELESGQGTSKQIQLHKTCKNESN